MEIKEVTIEQGYQFILTKNEFNDLYRYFHDRYVKEPIDNSDIRYIERIFDKLEDFRLANLK